MRKIGILWLVMIMVIVGCSSSPSSTSDPGKEATPEAKGATAKADLRVAVSAAPPTLDLYKTTATSAIQVGWHIFESLVTLDEQYQVSPLIAESIDTSEDGKTITFAIRKGLKFHNGKELTSEDILASVNRWKAESNNGKTALGNAVIEAKDSHALVVKLDPKGPSAALVLTLMAFPHQGLAVMPKEVIEGADEQGAKEFIGTGPFQFVEWKQDQYIHLKKFADYQPLQQPASGWAGKKEALVENLYFIPVPDPATRVAGIQSGEYDFADDVPIDNYLMLKDDPNLVMSIAKPRRWNGLLFNNKNGVFSNQKVRQAVNAAVDLDTVMMAAVGDKEFYRLDHGLMYPEQAWYVEDGKENYNQKDADKAKKLLEEAGYKGEPVTILATRDYEFLYKTAVVIKDQLEKMGIPANLEVYDWPTLIKRRSDEKAWDIVFTFFPIYTNPTQPVFIDSRNNYAGWYNNPAMDQLLDQIRVSSNFEEQREIFKKVQSTFWEDVPLIKLGDMHGLSAYRTNVKGYTYFYDIFFWNVSVE
ncbi:ABC transporter substrate-binding protein [Ammoniphilus sp. CFH 90114]|uniref:ABC transporter substrate-binding protein n=1 Tax=Ammoniphilus sp. CFH 90114 TaxID=2493665 RepID=UPI00100FE63B|nr:ABC transporter substrate-binding protein [Ammoniphilus sp. CFH 90114]RXT07169.1 ABC transporter substrate-binding protein [Ammoniphilus sp. CFH 90114]